MIVQNQNRRRTVLTDTSKPPLAPQITFVQRVSNDELTVYWTNVANETGYVVEISGDGVSNWVVVANPAADILTFADSGLDPQTYYYYRVKAVNAFGYSPYSNIYSERTATNEAWAYLLYTGLNTDDIELQAVDNAIYYMLVTIGVPWIYIDCLCFFCPLGEPYALVDARRLVDMVDNGGATINNDGVNFTENEVIETLFNPLTDGVESGANFLWMISYYMKNNSVPGCYWLGTDDGSSQYGLIQQDEQGEIGTGIVDGQVTGTFIPASGQRAFYAVGAGGDDIQFPDFGFAYYDGSFYDTGTLGGIFPDLQIFLGGLNNAGVNTNMTFGYMSGFAAAKIFTSQDYMDAIREAFNIYRAGYGLE